VREDDGVTVGRVRTSDRREPVPDAVTVTPAALADEPVLRRLMELYLHDFSELDGAEVGEHGTYGYPYLGLYWLEPQRHPFLVRVDGRFAGFALVRAGPTHHMAEFFVLRGHRRRGVGIAVARDVSARFPGAWSVHEIPGNDAAVAFWRRAIPEPFREHTDDDGTTQHFVQPPPSPEDRPAD
jgi:predicted acetyltransferase